jgi:lipopolysaccharide/colanic/teichoic acid biosynthesis glycosyltransferase
VNFRHLGNPSGSRLLPINPVAVCDRRVLNDESFRKMISQERKRSERSRKSFLLMLLDMGESLPTEKSEKILGQILSALAVATRETDETGWYKNRSVVGVMFTEIGQDGRDSVKSTIHARISDILRNNFSAEQVNRVSISFQVFPENWNDDVQNRRRNPTMYPDLSERAKTRQFSGALKRMMDIVGGAVALVFLAPVFFVIAVAIKATSKGPVFFRQCRIGRYGESFVFLKFRTMYVDNDASVHQEYVKHLIAGKAERNPADGKREGVYKLTRDSRITPVGAFLRKTSLDEVPQFINVLKGEMSLVGPRPPIPYEVERYDVWHCRRFLEAKPGITGLWQVNGRNRIKFDDMVRLDLLYARTWSPWLDFKILLRTPLAVIEGAH